MSTPPRISVETDPTVQRYRYLWLKYVVDVDLSQHCINTLVGGKSTVVNTRRTDFGMTPLRVAGVSLGEHPARAWYLCGVTEPYVWRANVHLAWRARPGGLVERSWPGLVVRLEGAEELPVDPDFIDPALPQAGDPRFATCRNWQFANFFAAVGM